MRLYYRSAWYIAMRIWDVAPGYLNRQSLLGEHRELHGLYNILTEGKKGYSRHPETLRWVGAEAALAVRHAQLTAEMQLRGYMDRSPLPLRTGKARWPQSFVTEPAEQFAMLCDKYVGKEAGRIPLPRSAQELWAQHKYSVLARDPQRYRQIGRTVGGMKRREAVHRLALELAVFLREPPPAGRLVNTLEHMWGHLRKAAKAKDINAAIRNPAEWLRRIQLLAVAQQDRFLLSSTALSELAVHIEASAE